MTRYLQIFFVIAVLNLSCDLVDAAASNPQHHPQAIGVHGMALFEFEDKVYASHMPLHHSIHSYQVVLEIQLPAKVTAQVKRQLKQKELFSIAPEVFDLLAIKNKKLTGFTARLFQGHFERGGQVIAEKIEIKIKKVLLFEPISAEKNGRFYLLKVAEKAALAIHQIGPLASYDQIFGISGIVIDKASFNSESQQPIDKLQLSRQLGIKVDNIELLYLETQDFK